MQFVPKGLAYTLRTRAPRRPDASPTVEVRKGRGGALVDAGTAATRSAVDTELTVLAEAGATVLQLDDTAGIEEGGEYLLEDTDTQTREFVRVLATPTGAVVLAHKLRNDYPDGALFRGTYLSYALTATHTATEQRDCWAIWSWALDSVSQPPLILRFDIVRHWVGTNPCELLHIQDHDSVWQERVPPNYDAQAGLDLAFNEVLRDLNNARRIATALADDDWKDVVAFKFLGFHVGTKMGERGKAYRAMWQERYTDRIEQLEAQTPYDSNENDVIEATEQGVYGGRWYR